MGVQGEGETFFLKEGFPFPLAAGGAFRLYPLDITVRTVISSP